MLRFVVAGPLARRVGVVHIEAEARAGTGAGPLQHLQVAVGVAAGGDGASGNPFPRCARLGYRAA